MSEIQIKIGDYAFTTLRPVPALVRVGGVPVQFVEIPGLIQGASEDRGGGKALLGVLRGADAIVFCQDASSSSDGLQVVRQEVAAAGIDLPAMVAATKMDDAPKGRLDLIRGQFPDLEVVPVSIIDDDSLDVLKEAAWSLTGLIRVYLRRDGKTDEEPLALPRRATALDVAVAIHKDLAAGFKGARVWGPSARFEGQRVGREHEVGDGDAIEVLV